MTQSVSRDVEIAGSESRLYPIDIAFADYDRTRPIIDGRVKADGLQLNANTAWIGDFCRRPVYEDYDAAEMSFSWYVSARARGEPVIALPIFPLRVPVWAYVFVRADSSIVAPRDLIGKRIGTEAYRFTVNLWLRGLFKDHYDFSPEQAEWVTAVPEGAGFVPPKGIRVETTPGVTAEENLARGVVDAIFCPVAPKPFQQGERWLRRLFPDAQRETHDFFRRTGLMPITHVLVMKAELAERAPWIAESLFQAFVEAQGLADWIYETDPKLASLFDAVFVLEQQRESFGPRPYSHGIERNRKTLETFVRYAHEQGYIPRPAPLEDLFVPITMKL
jgi:4,5-dihydroxyphthalate decarboxylase